jgi:hypothetical protein
MTPEEIAMQLGFDQHKILPTFLAMPLFWT